MNKLTLYGAGGHAKVIAEIAELNNYTNLVFFEDQPTKSQIWKYSVEPSISDEGTCVLAIGSNAVRKRLATVIKNTFVTLIHPKTQISMRAFIGEGSVVMAGASINADVKVGKHCIVNTNASIDHDCIIDDFVHLSPNVALGGTVFVGEGSHIGIGACVIHGIKIGKWCTIGAGAVIIKDVPDGCTVVGNPGRILKK
ncbi:acetyltransferase [Sphingobacterium sp. InxBP1]|uniref:acetyltransferase n=1 Tax=Sphingobacterium sp. InxBP1 TaxID=2870328 RepID=UPI0022448222|nr:acetyltransferase [Sphingobacterium sp. InxBP1]MCW8310873.1 acetyltransferase [Sphingobacterium sp. InxBP1]